jgi:hypothetical protein
MTLFDESTKIRNLTLEQLAADVEIECKRGCEALITYSNLVEHEKDCVGNVAVRCTSGGCGCDHESTLWSAAIAHHQEVS